MAREAEEEWKRFVSSWTIRAASACVEVRLRALQNNAGINIKEDNTEFLMDEERPLQRDVGDATEVIRTEPLIRRVSMLHCGAQS